MKIEGMEKVLANLNREIVKYKNDAKRGMIKAVAMVRRDMDKTPPLIPVDTGNLRAHWFTDMRDHWNGPELRFGFSASYAFEVHEKVGANFQRPGAGAKFLEAALNRNEHEILNIIRQEAKKA
jgi:hypothetical protein